MSNPTEKTDSLHTTDRAHKAAAIGLSLLFVGTVVAANWALKRYGIVRIPGTSLMAPAGVYFAGLAFGLRDALHELAGRWWVLGAIVVGAVVSYVIEDAATIPGGHAAIAVASAVAFLLSESCDLAVYEPLRRRADVTYDDPDWDDVPWTDHRWWIAAVIASNLVGAVVDSALFLWLAFGSLDHMDGQLVGKALMIAPALLLVWLVRRRR